MLKDKSRIFSFCIIFPSLTWTGEMDVSSTLEIKTSTKRKRSVTFLFDKQLNGIRSSIPKQNKQVDWTRWIINRLSIDYFCAAFFVSVFLRNCQQYHFDVDGKEMTKCKVFAQALCNNSVKSRWIILSFFLVKLYIENYDLWSNDSRNSKWFSFVPPCVSGVNFWKTLKTAGCAGEGGL